MRIGSLFSGIGGLELGLEWAGVGHTVWQVERDPFCRQVLARHWPNSTRYEDVEKFARRAADCVASDWDADEPWCPRCSETFGDCACIGVDQVLDECGLVDVICGGFPCQDISQIGKREGINGAQSGLWREFARIIGEMGPRYVVVENVARLARAGLDTVLGDLAALGYDAEWDVVSACSVGAPHTRERLFIVGYACCARPQGLPWRREDGAQGWNRTYRPIGTTGVRERAHHESRWTAEPKLGRVANGVRYRVDRIRSLGNAVVPQVAELVGRRLLAIDNCLRDGRAA